MQLAGNVISDWRVGPASQTAELLGPVRTPHSVLVMLAWVPPLRQPPAHGQGSSVLCSPRPPPQAQRGRGAIRPRRRTPHLRGSEDDSLTGRWERSAEPGKGEVGRASALGETPAGDGVINGGAPSLP